jgi:hypothetical protein
VAWLGFAVDAKEEVGMCELRLRTDQFKLDMGWDSEFEKYLKQSDAVAQR